jgi:hypothetical protein
LRSGNGQYRISINDRRFSCCKALEEGLGDGETWGLGDLETGGLGDWETGGLGDLETGRHGDLGTWRLGEWLKKESEERN